MTGRAINVARYSRPAPRPGATALLAVRELGREGDYHDSASHLAAGEVLGLAGLMGAGRTAVLKGIFSLPPADRGTIEVDGQPLAVRASATRSRPASAMCPRIG